MCNLRAQTCLHLMVHLVAGLHECPSQIHVVSWQAMVNAQSQRPWQEAHQVVLESKYLLTFGPRPMLLGWYQD